MRATRVGSRITTDASGRIGVATWSGDDLAPILHVVDPINLMKIGDPIALEAAQEWGVPRGIALAADPDEPGRFAVLFAHVYGHGSGTSRLARINTCAD